MHVQVAGIIAVVVLAVTATAATPAAAQSLVFDGERAQAVSTEAFRIPLPQRGADGTDLIALLPSGTLTNGGRSSASVRVWLVGEDESRMVGKRLKDALLPEAAVLIAEGSMRPGGSLEFGRLRPVERVARMPTELGRLVVTVASDGPLAVRGEMRTPRFIPDSPDPGAWTPADAFINIGPSTIGIEPSGRR